MGDNVIVGVEPVEVAIASRRAGFEALYRLEYPGLVAVASLLTGDRGDGEDLVQDTMVKAYLHWRRVGVLDRPGGWCHRVLLNACRSRWRRKRTERRGWEQLAGQSHSADGPSADVIAFWSLVQTLPVRARTVVTLHFAGERTMAEIAQILGVPEGTVHSDIARARVVILEALGE